MNNVTIKDAFSRSVLLHKVRILGIFLLLLWHFFYLIALFQSPNIGFVNVDVERSPGIGF